jgi:tRNA isopentenyl-2-thiomethyl-A-37 hydroxylase MiaE
MIVSESERRSMIELAAYLRAEARHFEAGHEVEDWLAAEAEVDQRLSYVERLTGLTAGPQKDPSVTNHE